MRTSEQIDLICAALAAAQAEFPVIEKSRNNPFFKSKYADLSDVLAGCIPVLSKHGLALLQPPSYADGRIIITSRLVHKSGQWFESELSVKPLKDDPQSLGSAITYGRRYSGEAMLGVSGSHDDDGAQASGNVKADHTPKKEYIEYYKGSDEQKKKLMESCISSGLTDTAIMGEISKELMGKPFTQLGKLINSRLTKE